MSHSCDCYELNYIWCVKDATLVFVRLSERVGVFMLGGGGARGGRTDLHGSKGPQQSGQLFGFQGFHPREPLLTGAVRVLKLPSSLCHLRKEGCTRHMCCLSFQIQYLPTACV